MADAQTQHMRGQDDESPGDRGRDSCTRRVSTRTTMQGAPRSDLPVTEHFRMRDLGGRPAMPVVGATPSEGNDPHAREIPMLLKSSAFGLSLQLIAEARRVVQALDTCVCCAIGCRAHRRLANIVFQQEDQGFSIAHPCRSATFVAIHDVLGAISPGDCSLRD